jgi:hypothetical protein
VATVIGGGGQGSQFVQVSLPANELHAAQQALFAAGVGAGLPNAIVYKTPFGTVPADPTFFTVYNIPGGVFTLPTVPGGAMDAVVLTGSNAADVTGHAGKELLIGNFGNDFINAAGGSGSVIVGNGSNSIELNSLNHAGGKLNILTGTGHDSIDMWGGSVTFSSKGHNTDIFANAGNNKILAKSAVDISIKNGHDTINLMGSGNDTITDSGNATVTVIDHGSGKLHFTETGSGPVSVVAGSGDATLIGGAHGHDTFVGGSGTSLMTATGGHSDFVAGTGDDTMNAGGSAANTFNFVGTSGGAYKVHGYVVSDTVHVGALTDTMTVSGGNTFIHLGNGTTIELVGYHGLVHVTH